MNWPKYTDTDLRSQTSYTALCNCIISHGAQIGIIIIIIIQVLAGHICRNKCKQNTNGLSANAYAAGMLNFGLKGWKWGLIEWIGAKFWGLLNLYFWQNAAFRTDFWSKLRLPELDFDQFLGLYRNLKLPKLGILNRKLGNVVCFLDKIGSCRTENVEKGVLWSSWGSMKRGSLPQHIPVTIFKGSTPGHTLVVCTVWLFKRVYHHAQTAVDSCDIHTKWITLFLSSKIPKTSIGAHAGQKIALSFTI